MNQILRHPCGAGRKLLLIFYKESSRWGIYQVHSHLFVGAWDSGMKMSMCVKTSPPPHTYTYTVGSDFCEATRWKEASVQRNHCDKTRYVQEEALVQGRKCHPCWGKSVKTSKWTGNLVTIRKDDEDYSQGTEVRLRRKYITYKARKIRNCRMCLNSTES